MLVVVEKVREGFEQTKTELEDMKLNIEAEKQLEREAFEKALEEKYLDRCERIDNMLSIIVYTEEVEVPEPVEEPILEEATETEAPPTNL